MNNPYHQLRCFRTRRQHHRTNGDEFSPHSSAISTPISSPWPVNSNDGPGIISHRPVSLGRIDVSCPIESSHSEAVLIHSDYVPGDTEAPGTLRHTWNDPISPTLPLKTGSNNPIPGRRNRQFAALPIGAPGASVAYPETEKRHQIIQRYWLEAGRVGYL